MDWTNEFPGLSATTYLNSCSYGLLSKRVRKAVDAHLDRWRDAPEWEAWSDTAERARSAFAKLVGARDDEIAIQSSASTGISAIYSTFQAGRIVTLDIDFPTSGFIARRQSPRGLQHEQLSMGLVRADAWAPKVRGAALAAIPAVASFTGYRLDVGEFVRHAHAHDVPVMVDAFQAAGTYPLDVKRTDVDFLATGVYKWLLGAAGLGFLYVRRDHHARVPTVGGWYAAAHPYTFDPLDDPAPDAQRFQYGGPSVIGCAAVAAGIELIQEIGLQKIERTNAALVDRVIEKARERKFEVLTPDDRASIASFRVPDLDRALAALERENVIVSSRIGAIRVSPHFYNSEADVDRLFEVLDRA